MSKEKEVKKNPEEETGKKTAKELQQEVAEKAKEVADAANKVAEAAEEGVKEAEGEAEAVTLNYGQFIQDVVDFLIIAFCIFLMVKGIAALNRKKDEEKAADPAPAPEPSAEEKLLTEIRDLLKK